MKIKYLVIIFTVYTLTSCHFFGQDARMTLAWYNREMITSLRIAMQDDGKRYSMQGDRTKIPLKSLSLQNEYL